MSDFHADGSEDHLFMTCDLYLAAFLQASGCKIVKNSTERKRVDFYFDDKDGLVTRLKDEYMIRGAQINAATYSDNIKSLKSWCADLMKQKGSRRY
jgi:hypothetical protein